MPDQAGQGCAFGPPFFPREDVPQHSFTGSNTWGLVSVRTVDADNNGQPDYPDSQTGLSAASVAEAIARNTYMLENASDLQLAQVGNNLRVRITNVTGHKLPTGFPDGRRIWVNVKFFDGKGSLLAERGAYDFATAALTATDTKVYEILLGLDAAQAKATGLRPGPSFHFVLANTVVKDNRIPPTGSSNSVAAANGTTPVGATYLDGQNWDDTLFAVPACAAEAVVTVHYQLVSREYIEFLRDTNVTDGAGEVAYEQWVSTGMSSPVVMDSGTRAVLSTNAPSPDLDGDGFVGINDLLELLGAWGRCSGKPGCHGDLDCSGSVGITDLLALLAAWDG